MRHSLLTSYRSFAWMCALLLLGACSSVDCPMANKIETNYQLAGDITTLPDTLCISTTRHDGNDTVLLNNVVGASAFSLPMSYVADTDTLYFHIKSESCSTIDTIAVSKLNHTAFEALDCTPIFAHTLTGVSHTHHTIDSIVINNPNVIYGSTSQNHILIYLKSNNY